MNVIGAHTRQRMACPFPVVFAQGDTPRASLSVLLEFLPSAEDEYSFAGCYGYKLYVLCPVFFGEAFWVLAVLTCVTICSQLLVCLFSWLHVESHTIFHLSSSVKSLTFISCLMGLSIGDCLIGCWQLAAYPLSPKVSVSGKWKSSYFCWVLFRLRQKHRWDFRKCVLGDRVRGCHGCGVSIGWITVLSAPLQFDHRHVPRERPALSSCGIALKCYWVPQPKTLSCL